MDIAASNYRRFMHINVVQYIKKYNDAGEETITKKIFQVKKCVAEDFNGSDYNKAFWESNQNTPLVCINDPEGSFYIQGTRDDSILKRDNAYFIIEISKCSPKTLMPGEAPCATME